MLINGEMLRASIAKELAEIEPEAQFLSGKVEGLKRALEWITYSINELPEGDTFKNEVVRLRNEL